MGFFTISGTMGGGKSYLVAEEALKAWKEGAIVHSNMDWNDGKLAELGFDKLHVRLPDDITQWKHVLQGGEEGRENLLIVDEGAMLFHAWDITESKKRDRDLFDVLVMSRKLGMDVYIISQHADNLNSAIRRIAQQDIRCVAVVRIPIIGPFLQRSKGDFLRILRQPENRKELSRSWHRFRQEVGDVYHTEAVRGAATEIQRNVTRTAVTKPKTPRWLKLGALAILVSAIFSVWSVGQAVDNAKGGKDGQNSKPAKLAESDSPSPSISEKVRTALTPSMGDKELVPPKLHPYGEPSGIKMQEVEWAEEDERIITCVRRERGVTIVHTLGGQTWRPGANIDGGWIRDIMPHAGAYFAIAEGGRVYYLRPRTYKERRAYDEYVIELAARAKQQQQQQAWITPSTSPLSSPAGQ